MNRAVDIGSFLARKIQILEHCFILAIDRKIKSSKFKIKNLTVIDESALRIIQHFHKDRKYRLNFKRFKEELARLNKRSLLLFKKTIFLNNQSYIVLVHESGKSNIVFQLWQMKIYTKQECVLDYQEIEKDYYKN